MLSKLIKGFFLIVIFICLLPYTAISAPATISALDSQYTAPAAAYPSGQYLYDRYRWSAMYFYGRTYDATLLGVLIFTELHYPWPEHVQALELAYTLNEDNFLRRFVSPIVGVVQLAANVAKRNGAGEPSIYEFNPYLIFRWANLPWNHYVNTSLALGEGVSYATSYPTIERHGGHNLKRLLNYLMFEATFAMPTHPRLQLLVRVHHRSGAYSAYQAANSGSNTLGLGIRYLFD